MLIHNRIFSCSKHSLPLLFLSLIISYSSALYVVDGSNCTAACTNSRTGYITNSSGVSCLDKDYNSTETGVSFQRCVSCELGSQAFNQQNGQTDLGWALCEQMAGLPWAYREDTLITSLRGSQYEIYIGSVPFQPYEYHD